MMDELREDVGRLKELIPYYSHAPLIVRAINNLCKLAESVLSCEDWSEKKWENKVGGGSSLYECGFNDARDLCLIAHAKDVSKIYEEVDKYKKMAEEYAVTISKLCTEIEELKAKQVSMDEIQKVLEEHGMILITERCATAIHQKIYGRGK